MKATEQYFPVVLHKIIPTFEFVDETLCNLQTKATTKCFLLVLFNILNGKRKRQAIQHLNIQC